MASRVALAAWLIGAPASAQPTLTIVAPAAPGGGWDQTARALQHVLGQLEPAASVQVENVPGAAGTIGLARFISAERGNPDALLVTGLVMLSATAGASAPVTLDQTTPIARLTGEYEAVVVPSASPLRTMDDLLQRLRAAPASVSWGGGSAGGTDDLLVRLIAEAAGVEPAAANYVAFSGGGAAVAALLGGQLTAGVSGYGEFAAQVEAGALRLLAISSPAPLPGVDAPTLRDQGLPIDLANWRGLVAPPGISAAERDALVRRVEAVARSREWQSLLQRQGWQDLLLTGAEFRQFLSAEQTRVEAVLHRLTATRSGVGTGPRFRPDAQSVPVIALVALAGLSATWWMRRNREGHVRIRSQRVWPLLTLLFAQAVLMPAAGFIPTSTLLFAGTAWLFGSRRVWRDVAAGGAIATGLHVTFAAGLGVSLPIDPVSRWLLR